MRITNLILAALAAVTFLASCDKEPNKGQKHVYAAAYFSHDHSYKSCYWTDGELHMLPSHEDFTAFATDLLVSDNGDVYVIGHLGNNHYACYWKNGKLTILEGTQEGAKANCGLFVDRHLIICGNDNKRACIWIDGKKIQLCSEQWSSVYAMAWTSKGLVCEGFITVDDGDNFVSRKWTLASLNSYPESSYPFMSDSIVSWMLNKGGVTYAKTNGKVYNYDTKAVLFEQSGFSANSVAVSQNGTIYCCGSTQIYAGNDAFTKYQPDSKVSYSFQALAVDGSDLYAAGFGKNSNNEYAFFLFGPDGKEKSLPLPEGTITPELKMASIVVK